MYYGKTIHSEKHRKREMNLKKMTKLLLMFLMLFMTVPQAKVYAAAPKISSKKIILFKGEKKVIGLENTKKAVKWKTSDKKIATIKKKKSNKVVIAGKKSGQAVITGRLGDKKYQCTVIVRNAGINKDKVTIKTGKTTTIRLKGRGKVKWSCSDKKILKITSRTSSSVTVKGIKKGTASINARIGKKTYRCKVRVTGKGKSKQKQDTGWKKYGKPEGWQIYKGKKKPEIKTGSVEDKVDISCSYSWEPVTEVNKKYKKKIYASKKEYDLKRQSGLSKKAVRSLIGGIGYGSQTQYFHYQPSKGWYPVTDTITITVKNKSSKSLHFEDTMYTAAVPVTRSGGVSASESPWYGSQAQFISEIGAFDVAAGDTKTIKYRHIERSNASSSDPHAPALGRISLSDNSCMNYYFNNYSSFVLFKEGSKEYAYMYSHLGYDINDKYYIYSDVVGFTGPAGAIFNPSWDRKLYNSLKAIKKYVDKNGKLEISEYPHWINEPAKEYIDPE